MSSTTSSLSPLLQQALAASQGNDSVTAMELLKQACQEEPASAWPHFLLGAELAQSGRYQEAETSYANAVLLAPTLNIARYELGTLQFTSGRASLALVTWQQLLSLPDADPLKLFALGYTELANDSFINAVDYFQRGIAANSVNAPLNGNIQLLIDRIRPLMQPSTEGTLGTESETNNTEHFLLAAYNNGSRH